MRVPFRLFDTYSKLKQPFTSLQPGYVGIYWCGPTPYGPTHLGHARSAVNRDLLVRWLAHEGYKVRLVSNITDVGHLLHDADSGEDKISSAARLAAVSPMEVVQRYTLEYHRGMDALNVQPPDIEPRATGHLIEQIELTEELLRKGAAYQVNGSVYFDVPRHHAAFGYGKLSGMQIDQMLHQSRSLVGGEEKRSPLDFALWKKASPEHIMQWSSPWGKGFPGWHTECTAMSRAYLGVTFDIHGGGLELAFPHHECEWAQAEAAYGVQPARFWMHHNMVTIEGRKMAKSSGHFISLQDCFAGGHPLLERAFPPMAVRMLFLQAHYRSPIDVSQAALQLAEKSYLRLLHGLRLLEEIDRRQEKFPDKPGSLDAEVSHLCQDSYEALADDLNSPMALASLFQLLTRIHLVYDAARAGTLLSLAVWQQLLTTYRTFFKDIFGFREELALDSSYLMETMLCLYKKARQAKDYKTVDWIRQQLATVRIHLQDRRDGGVSWQYGSDIQAGGSGS